MRIAVVGAGLSGSSIVKSIIDHEQFKKEDHIDVFEPRELLGAGLPYAADSEVVKLNVSPEVLSLDAANPNDFVEWLDELDEDPYNFEDLVSRPMYGRYLVERFAPYFNHPQVSHQSLKIEDMKVLDPKTKKVANVEKNGKYVYQLKTSEGWDDTIYDAVFFSVGHPPYADYYDLVGTENYVHNPYPMQEVLSGLKGDERVGIIGSGASGIDLMRYFSTEVELENPITYYVPTGQIFNFPNIPFEGDFQFTFSMEWIAENADPLTGKIPFDTIYATFMDDMKAGGVDVAEVYDRYKANNLEAMRRAIETNDQELALIHTYSGKLVGLLPYLFNRLSAADKADYLKNVHAKFLFFKARVPNKTFRWLFELMDAGKVRIVEGISEIHPQEDGTFEVVADETEIRDLMVNATGFDTNLANVTQHSVLVKNLYDQELILPHKDGKFVLVDWPQVHVINQKYGTMKNVFFFGLLIGGTQYENNDAQLTIRQATYSANWLMDNRNLFD